MPTPPLSSFLPPHLLVRLARQPELPACPHIDHIEGALLLSDISGFTRLTERLQEHGRQGAEEIAAVVNASFVPAIETIESWGGSIVSFGGDALFTLFPGEDAVGRAREAATSIKRSFATSGRIKTSRGSITLGVSQAIHHGRIQGVHVGSGSQRHYIVTGRPVAELARLGDRARRGEVRLSRRARRQLGRQQSPPPPRRRRPSVSARKLKSYLPRALHGVLGRLAGDYRHVSALFLETRHDDPEWLQQLFDHLCKVLDTYDGTLLKTDLSPRGTKWLCVFGVPARHEDDVDRCARAALDIKGSAPAHTDLRGAMHTGIAVNIEIGTRSRRCFDLFGDAINTASRALGRAAWGEMVVVDSPALPQSATTVPRGSYSVKGKAGRLRLHTLERPRTVGQHLTVSAPLVGRSSEMATLRRLLTRARAKRGGVVSIRGEPGIGKTRIAWELAQEARTMGFATHRGRTPSFAGQPFGAIARAILAALGLQEESPQRLVARRLDAMVRLLSLQPTDRRHLGHLLGLARERRLVEKLLDARTARQNDIIAAVNFFIACSHQAPLLLTLDDLHWAGEETRQCVARLAASAADAPLLLLLLHRPDFHPLCDTTIDLQPLDDADSSRLAQRLLESMTEAPSTDVAGRSGGNPLFVEELARDLLEQGSSRPRVAGADLPANIESLIEARMDRLSARERLVVQRAAVIGRRFRLSLLESFPDVRAHVRPSLEELGRRGIVVEHRHGRRREFSFRHTVTRDVVYGTLLVAERRRLHRAVAIAMEKLPAPDRALLRPQLGHHRERAGNRSLARTHYLRAARRAISRFSPEAAVELYEAYLRNEDNPCTFESVRSRLDLGRALRALGRNESGHSVLRRAQRLAAELDRRDLRAEARLETAILLRIQGRVPPALRQLRIALELSRRSSRRRLEADILNNIGITHKNSGRPEKARIYHEQALRIYRRCRHRDGEGLALGALATIAHQQGRYDEARKLYGQTINVKRQTGDRRGVGYALCNLADLQMQRGAIATSASSYRRALSLARDVGDRMLEGHVLSNLASVHGHQGDRETQLKVLDDALTIIRETGYRSEESVILGNRATVYESNGRLEKARELFDEALAVARDASDRRLEGAWNAFLANNERLRTGNVATADSYARRAQKLLQQVGDIREVARCLCIRGHLALCAGRSAQSVIERVERILKELGRDGEVQRALAMLRRAELAFREGRPLVRGQCPEDIPPAVLA